MSLLNIAAKTVESHDKLNRLIQSHLVKRINEYKSLRENHLEKLLSLFPDKKWDRFELSCNSNITWDIVEAHPNIRWSWLGLS